MTQLSWVTPQGSIANIGIGVPASVEILAVDSANYGDVITYQLIGGNLPVGMTVSTNGIISGTPEYSASSNNYFTTLTYDFIIRARSNDGVSVLDGSFSIIITNTVNSDFTWITPAGDLGTVPSGNFYQLPLQVSETQANTTVTFGFISGELPPGMQVVATGLLQGVPTLLNAVEVNKSETFRFTIRATNSQGHVRDRSFYLSVTNVFGPIIEPTKTQLGSVFDGSYFSQQLTVTELNPNVSITWSNIGNLPPGVTLNSAGLLSGYIQPLELVGAFGPAGFDGDQVDNTSGAVIQAQEFDHSPYDFNQLNQTLNYSFTIQAFDGANYDLQDYVLNVVSRSGYTADNANITADNTYLSVDTTNVYVPVILNANVTTLPTGRSGSYYAYKFDGYDFQGDPLTYTIANTIGTFDAYVLNKDAGFDYGSSDPETLRLTADVTVGGVGFDSFVAGGISSTNLPGVILDAQSGWLYGQLNPQSTAFETYNFGVQVSKTHGNTVYTSNPVYFNLPVLGDVNNILQWITPSDLGTIANGSVSDIVIEAKSAENKPIVYSLVDRAGVSIRLPQGLELVTDTVHNLGLLSGRVSFEAFSIDDYTTTFDSETMTIDRIYRFTVEAATTDGSAVTVQEFTLRLNVIDVEPYDNLYLRAMPAFDQRQIFNSIVSNTDIFVPELIYRPSDPWFGVAKDIEMLFLPGLTPSEVDTYAAAIVHNHYTKTYNFGDINTAVVLDNNYNVKYEVVYINVVDPELNAAGTGPGVKIDLTAEIANPYVDSNGNNYKIVYPNTSADMIDQLVSGVGYYDQSSLPAWMTSNQPDPTNPNMFTTPVGFTRAVVLAYTVPGASKLIAYRLSNSGINFNNINFTVDRYFLDDYYTSNFDTANQVYRKGRETTFDALPNKNIGDLVATVDYAVQVPFSQINGRPVAYINNAGGIDGIAGYRNGETLIFTQQENFLNSGPYDGWVSYTGAFIGDNTLTTAVEGYGSGGFDSYTVVPGYLENAQDPLMPNQRGGVWQINIVNGIVNLTPVLEVLPGQRIRVLHGNTFSGAIVYYNRVLSPGQTVPFYSIYRYQTSIVKRTTFNGDSTRFFSNRDSYYEPGTQDKYVKFPQYGVFT